MTNPYVESLWRRDMTILGLMKELEYKNHMLIEMDHKNKEASTSMSNVIVSLQEKIDSRERRLLEMTTMVRRLKNRRAKIWKRHRRELTSINTNMIHDMESLEEEHRQLTEELKESKALNDLQQKSFLEEIERLKREFQDPNPGESDSNLTTQLHTFREQLKGKMEYLETLECINSSLIVNERRYKEELLDARAEIINLKRELQDPNPGESDSNLTTQLHTFREQLKGKMEYLETVECINSSLIVNERRYKEELLDARAEIINHLQDMSSGRSHLGIKRMGELDPTPFQEACRLKYSNEEWQMISAQLCSSWEESLKNPNWHPFKKIEINGMLQEIVDENDEKLEGLRSEYGEMVYKAVENALMELENYNPSGRYAVSEIWNWKEGRRASLKEAIQYITKQLKSFKRKRKRER